MFGNIKDSNDPMDTIVTNGRIIGDAINPSKINTNITIGGISYCIGGSQYCRALSVEIVSTIPCTNAKRTDPMMKKLQR
jgi:hypothetical protein